MSIVFQCGGCGKELKAPPEMAGRKAKCKVCATITPIPTPAAGGFDDDIGLMPLDDPAPVSAFTPAPAPIRVAPKAKPRPSNPYGGIPLDDDADDLPMADYAPAPGAMPAGAAGVPSRIASAGTAVLQKQMRNAEAMVGAGRYVEAAQALKQIAHQAGGDPGYHYLAGMAYAGLGNHPHALDHLAKAGAAGIRNPDLYAAKGRAELALGRFPDAIESLDTALDLAGTDVPDYMAELARAYDGAKMKQDAGATWAALAQINPNHPALLERERTQLEKQARRQQTQAAQAMVQMQKEQRASDTACWICIILRILLECL